MEYLSKERFDELAAELRHLVDEVYPKVTEELAETSAQGDRSDNAGYREAKRIQGKTNQPYPLSSEGSGAFTCA